jgi:nucleoside-diphosphate-sugar epimerase
LAAYAASKIKAYNATLNFIATKNPHFEITNIMPSFVMGKNELATTTEAAATGSNRLMMNVLLGKTNPVPSTGTTVHIDDMAFVLVKALDPAVAGNEKFACNSNGIEGIVWNEANDIVRKYFPDAVKEGILPANGSCGTNKVKFDARRTEEVLGFKFKGWEEQVVSQAGWYIELVKREKAATKV